MQLKLLGQFHFVFEMFSSDEAAVFKQNFQELSARDIEHIPPNLDVYFCTDILMKGLV